MYLSICDCTKQPQLFLNLKLTKTLYFFLLRNDRTTVVRINIKSAAPKTWRGILNAGWSCRTLVVGMPPREAAKKRTTKAAPIASIEYNNEVNFLSVKVIPNPFRAFL